ncbi:MAG: GNAT family N-acetyltransferase [Myxococcales bacterium]|nr:GNAT family N-acetyltransferase [Myxococcales bacterium]
MSGWRLEEDDLTHPEVVALLRHHFEEMRRVSPPESCHVLDLSGLRDPAVTLWSLWEGPALLGLGGLKALDGGEGEVKSMHTVARHRGRGVAAALLDQIVAVARRRGYRRLSLETGAQHAFEPARRFYAQHGFVICPPFASYRDDPNSVFMTRELTAMGA